MATISVVIPALNDGDFLKVCLAALAGQTRPADEIIVVDNGSTDATAAVAHAAGVRLLREARTGIFPATSTGFDAATGDIIARLDTDSVPAPDWLERIERSLATLDAPAAVTGSATFYGANAATRWMGQHFYLGGYFFWMTLLLGHPPLFGSNFAMHRELWERARKKAHTEERLVHDDLDLSIHLPPGTDVLFDQTLRVAVSARPFAGLGSLGHRIRVAFLTFAINAGDISFIRRRAQWRRAARRRVERRTAKHRSVQQQQQQQQQQQAEAERSHTIADRG